MIHYISKVLRKARKDIKRKERNDLIIGCIKALKKYPPNTRILMLDKISIEVLQD